MSLESGREFSIVRPYAPKLKVPISFPKKGRTKQSFRDECDINLIMAKYQKTGAIAHVNRHGADYGFATSLDFTEAMRTVTIAQDMFLGLPSSIRSRFGNDPAAFLDFVQDADNEDELIKLGLFSAEDKADKVSEEPPPAAPSPPPAEPDPVVDTEA